VIQTIFAMRRVIHSIKIINKMNYFLSLFTICSIFVLFVRVYYSFFAFLLWPSNQKLDIQTVWSLLYTSMSVFFSRRNATNIIKNIRIVNKKNVLKKVRRTSQRPLHNRKRKKLSPLGKFTCPPLYENIKFTIFIFYF